MSNDLSPEEYQIVIDPIHGYRRLDPLPDEGELDRFYQSKYYDLLRKGGRAPELRRLMAGGSEGESERAWLHGTLYDDISFALGRYAPGKRVLDVGCGNGELASFLCKRGFEAIGIEPALEAVAVAQSSGLTVYQATLEEFVTQFRLNNIQPFDVLTLLNVLEHVRDPANVVKAARTLLGADGVICIRVPNDFTEIQAAAQTKLDSSPWWIAAPDHINYFDMRSLEDLLTHSGFEIVYTQTDFPMELFLLMGEVYVNNPKVGDECHKKRVEFELSIPSDLRRRIYQALAEVGVGRDSLAFARKIEY